MNDTLVFASDDLPANVKGCCFENYDGDYVVLVNSIYCPETQRKTARHELRHIKFGHLGLASDSLEELEIEAE